MANFGLYGNFRFFFDTGTEMKVFKIKINDGDGYYSEDFFGNADVVLKDYGLKKLIEKLGSVEIERIYEGTEIKE